MADYQKMYYILFNALTDAIRQLEAAQQACEDAYLAAEDEAAGRAPNQAVEQP